MSRMNAVASLRIWVMTRSELEDRLLLAVGLLRDIDLGLISARDALVKLDDAMQRKDL